MMQSSKTPNPQSGLQKDVHKVRPQVYAASVSYSVAQWCWRSESKSYGEDTLQDWRL
jgi:hypothetical protein